MINGIVILTFLLILFSPAVLWCAEKAQLELPSWITSEDARYLAGGRADIDIVSVATPEHFIDRVFQSDLERELGNYIPLKAIALLGNAQWQRTMIEASNLLFGFECYPTYFASTTLYVPSRDILTGFPGKSSSFGDYEDAFKGFVEGLKGAAIRYPDKRFHIYLADTGAGSEFNPANYLVSGTYELADIGQYMDMAFQGQENISVDWDAFTSTEDLFARRYGSDSHWNAYGALKAYNDLADASGLVPYLSNIDYSYIGPLSGAATRGGLMFVEDEAWDADIDFSNLLIARVDGSFESGVEHRDYRSSDDALMKKMNLYEEYYGTYNSSVRIDGPGNGSALLLTDSFGGALKRYLAQQYEHLYTNWTLAGVRYKETLADLLEGNEVDDVYIVGVASNFTLYKDGKEHFFD